MKKLLAQVVLLGLLLCFSPLASFSASFDAVAEAPPGCPLNSPTNFYVGTVTSHSADLFWSPPVGVPPGTTVTYKVTMYDNTAGVALPTYYTTALSATYDGLPMAHSFTTTVCAGACGQNGTFGPAAPAQTFKTAYIVIVDYMPGYNDNLCILPGNSVNMPVNQVITVALPTSAGQSNGTIPIGHFLITNPSTNASVDIALAASNAGGGWHATIKEKQIKTVGAYPGQGVTNNDTRYVYTEQNLDNFLVRIYECQTVYVSPTFVYVKMQFGQGGGTLDYCGVTYTLGGGCGDCLVGQNPDLNATQTNQIPSSLNDRTALSDESAPLQSIQLTPNPTGDRTVLSFSMAQTGPVQLAVYNTMGALVALPIELPEILEKGNYQVEIPSEQLPTGMYFLTLQSATGRQTVRLMKQ
jgi:hypothetical protein